MALTKVLIKFTGEYAPGNVISTLAVKPDIFIPVVYGDAFSDRTRSRYNFFFHRKGIPTICAEPVRLERYLEADMEVRLERLLEKYQSMAPVVDMADADRQQALALGCVLQKHKYWGVSVLDYRIRESIFLPLKNGEALGRLTFPRLYYEDFAFLRGEKQTVHPVLVRSDLTKTAAAEIRTLGRLYAEKPSYWKDLSGRLKYTLGEIPDDKLEFIIDAASLGIRDAAFEELRDLGILRFFERKNGIVRLCFADRIGRNLLTDIGSLPRVYVFLTAALVREYGKKAAYHDLMLTEEGYITGIRRCLPVVIGLGGEGDTPERTAEFVSGTAGLFDEPVRRIMVYFGNVPRSPAHVQAAERFQVETASIEELTKLLEPR